MQFLGVVRVSDLPTISNLVAPKRSIPVGLRAEPQAGITIQAVPPIGTTTNPPPFLFNKGWRGLTFAQASGAPPDVSIAVGRNQIVETINTAMVVYDKNGNVLAGPVSLDTFFSTGSFPGFDPKVMYDPESDRFFLVLIGVDDTNNQGRAFFATSQTGDPTGAWTTFILVTENGSFPDYPGFGFCSDKVVVSANQFSLPAESFTGAEFWVIRKADLIAGSTTPAMAFFPPSNLYFTVQPAESQTPTTTQFMIAVDNFSFASVHFFAVTGEPGVTPVNVTRTVLASNQGSFPPPARQMGGPTIDTLDDRFLRATWRSGIFWATATGACTPPGDSAARSCPRLMQIDTSGPTITQDFSYGVATFDFYDAAATTDALGNLAVVFTRSSLAEFPGLHFAGRLAADPPNTASAPALLKAGERFYDCTFCSSPERWGDYFHAVRDPVDGTLWVAGEFMGSPTSNDYATFIANLVIPVVTTSTTSTTTTSSTTTTTSTSTTTTSTSTTTTSTSTTTTSTSTTTTSTSTTTTTPPPRGANWSDCAWEMEIAIP